MPLQTRFGNLITAINIIDHCVRAGSQRCPSRAGVVSLLNFAMAEGPSQSCSSRMAMGLGSGFIAGNLFGGIASNWGEVPVVLKDKPWPALARTGSVMLATGATLGLVGLAYATVDVSLKYRGEALKENRA